MGEVKKENGLLVGLFVGMFIGALYFGWRAAEEENERLRLGLAHALMNQKDSMEAESVKGARDAKEGAG